MGKSILCRHVIESILPHDCPLRDQARIFCDICTSLQDSDKMKKSDVKLLVDECKECKKRKGKPTGRGRS